MESLKKIERTLDYEFDNPDLLQQAFVRRSYSEENGGQNNEVLEFIGDKALDLAVIRIMMDRFGKITEDKDWNEFKLTNPKYFKTKIGEGKFTDLKKQLVQKKALAQCIDELGFASELIMGKGDEEQNVQESDSVKEDLFEAIIGAVTLDCDYDLDIITDVVENMIDFDSFFQGRSHNKENYVGLLQEWSQRNGYGLPTYRYEYLKNKDMYQCNVFILGGNNEVIHTDFSTGESKAKARMNACNSLYQTMWNAGVIKSQYEEEVGKPNRKEATRQLNELYQKGLIARPVYEYFEEHDATGSSYWQCSLSITGEEDAYLNGAYTKKEAQRECAYECLCNLMGYEVDDEEESKQNELNIYNLFK